MRNLEYGELTFRVSGDSFVLQVSNFNTCKLFCHALDSYNKDHKNPKQESFRNTRNDNTKNQRQSANFPTNSSYKILGLNPQATLHDIHSAYRKLAQENHPDKVANMAPEFRNLAEERMKELNAAYSELLKNYKR